MIDEVGDKQTDRIRKVERQVKAERGEVPGGCRAAGRESERVFNRDLPLRTDVIVSCAPLTVS